MKLALSLLASTLVLATAMPSFADDTKSAAPPAQTNSDSSAAASSADTAGSGSAGAAAGSSSTDNTGISNSNTNAAPGGSNVTARDPQTVLAALSADGYPGKLSKLDNGRPSIAVKISGLNTYIDFYNCADDMTDCYTLLFSVSLDLDKGTTLEQANKWNSDQITGRVWLDTNNDPTLDFALSTFAGISEDTFDQNLKLWDSEIGDFKDFFHF